jgi:hypothetical protein
MIDKIPLSPEEKKSIKSDFYQMLVAVVIIFSIFISVSTYILLTTHSVMPGIIIGVISLVLGITFTPMIKNSYIDVKSLIKLKVSGKVTFMQVKENTSKSATSSQGNSIRRYFVEIDGFEIQVEFKTYRNLKIGDTTTICVSEGSLVEITS